MRHSEYPGHGPDASPEGADGLSEAGWDFTPGTAFAKVLLETLPVLFDRAADSARPRCAVYNGFGCELCPNRRADQ
jgi:hypothetical protein